MLAQEQRRQFWTRGLPDTSRKDLFLWPQATTTSSNNSQTRIFLNGSISKALQSFCAEHKTAAQSVLLSALQATQYRLTGASNTRIALLQSDRKLHTILVESNVAASTFKQLVLNIDAQVDAQHDQVSRKPTANPKRDEAGTTLALLLHPTSAAGNGLTAPAASEGPEVLLELWQSTHSFEGQVSYSAGAAGAESISSLINIFHGLLQQCIAHPDFFIFELSLSGGLSPWQDIEALSLNASASSADASIVDMFQRHVSSAPATIAIETSKGQASYAELDELSRRVASWLSQQNLARQEVIGVLADQSIETVAAFLGVLKAGLVYLPLDIQNPAAWTTKVLDVASANKLVLCASEQRSSQDYDAYKLVAISQLCRNENVGTAGNPAYKCQAADIAYVSPTFGADGLLENIQLDHREIVSMATCEGTTNGLQQGTAIAHMTSIDKGASAWEIFTAILNGCTLVCLGDSSSLTSEELSKAFIQEDIKAARFKPELLERCLAENPSMFESLQLLVIAGGTLSPQVAKKALLCCPNGDVLHAYTSTKHPGLRTAFLLSDNDVLMKNLPIGQAVSDSGVLVVDASGHAVPADVLGELAILEVSRNNNANTSIIRDGAGNQVRAYLTGDIVRRRAVDDEFELCGSLVPRTKIQGRHISLSYIEKWLLALRSVQQATLLVRDGEEGEVSIVAAVEAAESTDSQTISPDEEASNDAFAVAKWTDLYDGSIYDQIVGIDTKQVGRDFVGWLSMLDGSKLDEDEMGEWLQDTMITLHNDTKPGRILEIGSGTGMILFNLDTRFESYTGLEPVTGAVRFVHQIAATMPEISSKVDGRVGDAAGAIRLENAQDLDTVIINSVTQHFPSGAYLKARVNEIIHKTSATQIFWGDIRSFAVYDEFLVAMARARLGTRATLKGLDEFMQRAYARERELLVHPAFFTALKDQYADSVEHVEILPKRMVSINELSCYRYTAVVHIRRPGSLPLTIHKIDDAAWTDYMRHVLNVDGLRQHIKQDSTSTIVAISNIANDRTSSERIIVDALNNADATSQDTPLRDITCDVRHAALSVRELETIARETGFALELSCARNRGSLDAVFHKLSVGTSSQRVLFDFPTEHQSLVGQAVVSRPEKYYADRTLEQELQRRLQASLPAYMVPSSTHVVNSMPRHEDGLVDREALARMVDAAGVDARY